ncbi:hypothetical protein AAVH_42711 [Aphelenchoides avenae]|nr:hypothetical protein AAVH_42711 [Aphelenchus avenae]
MTHQLHRGPNRSDFSIDLADCAKFESDSVKDLAAYATEQAQRYAWKFSQDSLLEPRKCRKCEERLKSFYDAEKQRMGELSWHVRRRINEDARTMYSHLFWWTINSFLNAREDQQ